MPVTIAIELPDEVIEGLRTAAEARGEDLNRYATVALTELARRTLEGRREGIDLLASPATPSSDSFARLRAKHGLPDLSSLSPADLAGHTDEAVRRMPDAVREALLAEEPDWANSGSDEENAE